MKVRFFDPGKSYKRISKEVLPEIKRVLSSGDLILRGDLEKFEADLAAYLGVKHAIGLNSGTDALYLALWAKGVRAGDEIIVPAHTFVATAQVVAQLGATPVLYDLNTDLSDKITDKTKGIIVAHIAGEFGADMTWLLALAHQKGLFLIEDACQALGAVQKGKKAGAWALAGCFSFYPAKILGAFGDAGALVTDDDDLAREVRELRNHYKSDYSKWGINSRLDNLQAAVLNVKLKYHPLALARRAVVAERYKELGSMIDKYLKSYVGLPAYIDGRVWQDYVIWVQDRDGLYDFLKEKGIETMKNEYHFPIEKPAASVDYEAHTLRLPCNENLTDKEVDYVIACIKEFYANR